MNNACTFFGHHYYSEQIEPALRSVLIDLIEKNKIKTFYAGNQGKFDSLVHRTLFDLSREFAISFYVVLAYMPEKRNSCFDDSHIETVLPDGIEKIPKRYAIDFRNKWMIINSDYVVTYVRHDLGSGAARFKRLAEKKNKTIIEI